MNILVIGGTGLVGSYLLPQLVKSRNNWILQKFNESGNSFQCTHHITFRNELSNRAWRNSR